MMIKIVWFKIAYLVRFMSRAGIIIAFDHDFKEHVIKADTIILERWNLK